MPRTKMTVLRNSESGHFSAVYGQRICLLFFLKHIHATAASSAFQSRGCRCSQNNLSQHPIIWQKNVRWLIEEHFRWNTTNTSQGCPLYSKEIPSHLKIYYQPKEESNMANRARPIRKEICLTEQEEQIIKSKMAELGTHNWLLCPQNADRRLHN